MCLSYMAATATAIEPPKICSSLSAGRQLNRRHNMFPARIAVGVPFLFQSTSFKSSGLVRASEPQRDEVNSSTNDPNRAFASQEDLNYLWKLGAGSAVGAAAIKYASVIFPEIARPNILEAMAMVFAPVVAVFLLIRQTRLEKLHGGFVEQHFAYGSIAKRICRDRFGAHKAVREYLCYITLEKCCRKKSCNFLQSTTLLFLKHLTSLKCGKLKYGGNVCEL
ncbi:Glutamyl-tRNA reductase [Actinidia chinensis var. chinensis]|uniref:Glutamyl-tRNA reductase n=1 Tax=Actinidia chinensis var. chinensis TaxID=1590841 RepID=A0A2R6QG10_ACTCC|nr:Glutamyl-tRNA reductase [Actinidia chinensis var. chinensis]